MDPRVRDLYKSILVVGRDYPAGLEHVRERAKAEFGKRAALTDDARDQAAIARPLHGEGDDWRRAAQEVPRR